MMKPRSLALLGLTAALVAGCASKNSVGDANTLNFKDKVQTGLGQGSATPSRTQAPKPVGTGQVGIAPTQRPTQVRVTRPPTQVTKAPQQLAFVISINSDTSSAGSQFTPSVARVFQGQQVTFRNADAKPRSVVADDGAFTSPMLAPGQTWIYTASKVGTFSYHDGTRPYAVASLQVFKR